MERDNAKKTPRIRYLSRREMLGLMGSTAAAITLAGCGGSEQSGQSGSGESTSTSTAETTGGAATETASTTCVVRPEQTEGPYYVDTGLDRSDIREERPGVPLELTFNVSRVDEGDISACGPPAGAPGDAAPGGGAAERPRAPPDLTFRVSRVCEGDVSACGPLAGALVDVWQCDALGEYSGVEDRGAGDFDTTGATFLRGRSGE